jgi:hypothetical protein
MFYKAGFSFPQWHLLFKVANISSKVMEMYTEIVGMGDLAIEITVQKIQGDENTGYWSNCTARTIHNQIVWTCPVTTDLGDLKTYRSPDEALGDAKRIFSFSPEDQEFYQLAKREVDPDLYYFTLV